MHSYQFICGDPKINSLVCYYKTFFFNFQIFCARSCVFFNVTDWSADSHVVFCCFSSFCHRVLKSSMMESLELIGPFTSHYIFNGLLIVLQVLHIIWFYMILRMVHEFIVKGQVMKINFAGRFVCLHLFIVYTWVRLRNSFGNGTTKPFSSFNLLVNSPAILWYKKC